MVIIVWAIVVFVAVEGLSSALLFGRELGRLRGRGELAERQHTKHDPLLGWVAEPKTYLPNAYGEGVYVRINGQGFRDNDDVPAKAPAGRTRIICSGDSYTFGYGVNNEQAWCPLLETGDPRLITINMGQGGYGVDQAYLWYERDAAAFEHKLHLFAFITLDFHRMQSSRFMWYPKPTLAVENGALVVRDVPVPQRSLVAPAASRFEPALRQLKTTHLMERILVRLGLGPTIGREQIDERTWTVAAAVFERLREINRARGSTLVLVYLPTQKDFADPMADFWRAHVRDLGARAGIAVVDLIDDFRKLPPADIPAMFIQSSALDYTGAVGHMTVSGNQWVARTLHDRLAALPGVLPPARP